MHICRRKKFLHNESRRYRYCAYASRYLAAIAVSVGKLQSHREIVGTTKRIAGTYIQELAVPRYQEFMTLSAQQDEKIFTLLK